MESNAVPTLQSGIYPPAAVVHLAPGNSARHLAAGDSARDRQTGPKTRRIPPRTLACNSIWRQMACSWVKFLREAFAGEGLLRVAFQAFRGCAGCSFEMKLGGGLGEYTRQTEGRGRVEERVEAAILHIA